MKASEARELSSQNEMTSNKIVENIKNMAKGGYRFFLLREYVSLETKSTLISWGYKLSERTDRFDGASILVIEW